MNTTVDHVLLTRFNLPSAGVERTIRAQEGWLRERVQLFERICLPSVRQQTDAGFAWIIYFDPQSPDWLRDWIAHVNADGIFRPIFRASVNDTQLRGDLDAAVGVRQARLLTTNLDNDDGLSRDFVQRAKAAASTFDGGRRALYFSQGLIKKSDELYVRVDRRNAFCSVVESWEHVSSCWADWHNLLDRHMPAVEIGGDPAWLQVIHGHNVSNRVRGRRMSPVRYGSLFPGLLDDVPVPGRAALLLDVVAKSALRGAREAARSGAKRVTLALVGKEGLDRLKVRLARPTGAESK